MAPSTQHAAPGSGCLVVGMGASAGGLNAFRAFFSNMPSDSGMAFVLVPHLDPNHSTFMVELIARCTHMKVQQVTDGMLLVPNEVFIIPPNKYLNVDHGVLRLTGPVQREQTAIDSFLQSLAADRRENAVGIVLSGTGAHGALGLKAIKAAGGMAIVQDPASAEHDGMPQRAIETGVVDCVRRVEEMPETLLQYATHLRALRGQAALAESSQELDQLIALLLSRFGHDFGNYRKRMLMRRIERRMSLCRVERFADYVEVLQNRPEESAHLVKDLLIRVTGFFRDAEAFQVLKGQVLPALLPRKGVNAPLRVWVAGCATGEEAYTLAMLIQEQLADQTPIPVTIFATDVDEDALAVARRGVYPEASISGLSHERLARFFLKEEDGYRVIPLLREMVTFSRHNLINDPPFAHLDLTCCRNVLIYLEPWVQTRILRLLHYALDEGGYLLLGPSETVGVQAGLFEPISRRWRIYRRVGSTPEINGHLAIARPSAITGELNSPVPAATRQRGHAELTKYVLLETFAPAAVLIDRNERVLYFHGATDRFLNQRPGEPTSDVLELARDGMRGRLRAAINECLKSNLSVVKKVRIRREDGYHSVTITVLPVPRAADGQAPLLVTFADEPPSAEGPPTQQASEEPLLRQLEEDLKTTREDLQSTIEEMRGTNEELKTSNEEVMSMNEELQSAHEEMETSKEELQSLNEELSTANGQLAEKVDELERINNDLSNLLTSTDIALVFLDPSFCITRFTPAATKLFHVVDTDVGRPLAEIARRFTDAGLLADARKVLGTLAPLEKEIDGEGDRRYLRRIAPYRTALHRVGGVAITFLDVTQLRRAAEHERWLATVLTDSNDAILVTDLKGKIQAWNRGASAMYGYEESEAMDMNVEQLVPAWLRVELRELIRRMCRGDQISALESQRLHRDGHVLDVWMTMTALRDDDGHAVAIARTERDITSRKALEREVLESAANEQQRIGQELHDNTGQELTGLGLMAQSLSDTLATRNAAEASLAAKIAAGLRLTLAHVRTLAKGLVPVEIDAAGLTSALADLAAQTSNLHGIKCAFTCPRPMALSNFMATHLYRIAQEAITNSIKHGPAQTILMKLSTADDVGTLEIVDDGVGIGDPDQRGDGIGLRIMSYRAGLIGATLHVSRGSPSGTRVICTFSAATLPN